MYHIYLDYASLTPIDPKVLKYMKKYSKMEYSNPSSLHTSGVQAKKALDEARKSITQNLHAHADEIIFTGSGTEANNIALQGIPDGIAGKHIIVSAIEHSSIIETARALEKRGTRVTYIPVDKNGIIDLDILKKSITSETVLVSIMMVNNEIGTIEPLHEVVKIIRNFRKINNSSYPLLHTDACQAPLYLDLNMEKLGVDLMTLDSHKICGPRGIGMLYVRRGIVLSPIMFGGSQEKGLRPGTENIPGITGFAYALNLAMKMREKETVRIAELRNYFISELLKINPEIAIHGSRENSIPHILNISIPNIDSEFFILQLDAKGIECSTKSACLHDEDESYVLKTIGADSKKSVRFSFGRWTKKGEVKKVIEVMKKALGL